MISERKAAREAKKALRVEALAASKAALATKIAEIAAAGGA